MKSKRNMLTLAAVSSLTGLAVFALVSSAGAGGAKSLEGSWWVTADWVDMAGAPVSADALATFNYDGGVIETPSEKLGVSAGHGAWEGAGNRSYGTKVIYFRYDAMGVAIGTTEVESWIRLNAAGNWFNGRFRTHHLDLDGVEVGSFDGLVHGSRIEVN